MTTLIDKFRSGLKLQALLIQYLCFTVHPNPSGYAQDNTRQAMKLENMHQSAVANPSGFTNGGSSVHQSMQPSVGVSGLSMRNDVPSSLLMAQNSNMGLTQGMNGEGMIKPESRYVEEPSFMYNAANNVLGRHPAMADVPIPSFIGEESNPKPVNDPIVDPDTSSFGFLGQIPRNFSLSDLTADFSISSGFSLFLSLCCVQ